ncbi:hypothetical protein EV188_105111 [Actinomycetospora succinea]|uniref:Uncharacterized protein n=1 Tax=Actinomycetospora succinea TaxID=663603 RepID=A0A4R6V5G1_9PSEU|nr:hypothetical protein [Actinomycetospora succinea]TDQ55715.1 hypothetical protein EV188_105111 [Actinomycetospora succinea]
MSAPGGGAGDAGRAAQERLTEEARATASALIDWLGARVEASAAGTHGTTPGPTRSGRSRLGMRPPQSPGPCSWCPVCALVAALRGEQPELTAKLAEQASGLMALVRLMVQAHQDPSHGHAHHTQAPTSDAPPAGWPAEWGAWDGWGAGAPEAGAGDEGDDPVGTPSAAEPPTAAPRPTPRTRRTAASGPAGRQVPIRRASPRSAAFRDTAPATAEYAASADGPATGDTTAGRAATAATTAHGTTEGDTTVGDTTATGDTTAGRAATAATTAHGTTEGDTTAGDTTANATAEQAGTAADDPRASAPRSAARGTGGAPRPAPRRATTASTTASTTAPPTTATTAPPTTATTASSTTGTPPAAPPTAASARPSVQRIAIRRPERPGRRGTRPEQGPPGGQASC